MSTILKALRQLEEDKAQSERDLIEEVVEPTAGRRSRAGGDRRRLWIGGALGLAGVALLAMVFLPLLRAGGVQEAGAGPPGNVAAQGIAQAAGPREPAAAEAEAPSRTAANAAETASTGEPGDAQAASGDGADAGPSAAAAKSARDAEAGDAGAAPAQGSARDLPIWTQTDEETRQRLERVREVTRGIRESRAAAAAATGGAAEGVADAREQRSEPLVEAAEPVEPRRRIVESPPPLELPELAVERTVWHPSSERREAELVDRRGEPLVVREGESVLGYRIVEITPSAVVFGREGQTATRRIGER